MNTRFRVVWLLVLLFITGCSGQRDAATTVTFPASRVGKEAELLREQLQRYEREHPEIRIHLRDTSDAADQRHQLYVQWLNVGASQPDILQLDVIWTAEFAAAGWILPLDQLDQFESEHDDFFSATLAANRWQGQLYARPWFVDVGMLYYRTDLIDSPPATFDELASQAAGAMKQARIRSSTTSATAVAAPGEGNVLARLCRGRLKLRGDELDNNFRIEQIRKLGLNDQAVGSGRSIV